MRNIVIEKLETRPIEEREIEIVERKGVGHPDTICDLVCEKASEVLSQYYLKNFGKVLHHNLDKGLLVAGKSQPHFGGGKILEPIKIIVAGRATDSVGKRKIAVEKIVKEEVFRFLKENLHYAGNFKKYFQIIVDYNSGAANLQEVFKRTKEVALANDTSFGVAHGPYSQTEKLTLLVANTLNSKKFTKKYPFVGSDVKVMALRNERKLTVTFSVSYIDKFIKNVKDYFEKKERVRNEVENLIKKKFNFQEVNVFHNTLDNPKATSEGEIYLTVLGLSAEHGDDGQVGRGNRVSGLITPCREMSLEAAAGKNINHPGKLYQILAFLIAQKIGQIEGVKECSVRLLSQIGKPLDQPQVASVKLMAKNFEKTKEMARKIVDSYFENLKKIQMEIVKGHYQVC